MLTVMTVRMMRIRLKRLSRDVVLLADELVVVEDVQLLAGAQLLLAHEAGEAVQVKNLVPRFSHEILGVYALRTAAALCPVSSANTRRSRA